MTACEMVDTAVSAELGAAIFRVHALPENSKLTRPRGRLEEALRCAYKQPSLYTTLLSAKCGVAKKWLND
jgi:hypothetical protein